MTLADVLNGLDGFAGLAALVNGLVLWPIVRSLRKDHTQRLERLEHKAGFKLVPMFPEKPQ